ncbi:hypothetical protein CP98_03177 [Sphingobium yanoikuyae]|jgi:hypothetical protein|uniref:Uncharacterized protein n=1 Tax=Sphingobium yanoikuyae TaxID=13690 RepID=A0A084EIA2_SPHYA|nr:hypothetical protein CP98_03177 [Sphingobium yanoikuyae]
MIDIASIASMAAHKAERLRRLNNQPPLSDCVVIPLTAHRAGASGDLAPFHGSPSSPRGPVIEADRSAYQSDPGDECPCPICTSDCARIVPCQRENDR